MKGGRFGSAKTTETAWEVLGEGRPLWVCWVDRGPRGEGDKLPGKYLED